MCLGQVPQRSGAGEAWTRGGWWINIETITLVIIASVLFYLSKNHLLSNWIIFFCNIDSVLNTHLAFHI